MITGGYSTITFNRESLDDAVRVIARETGMAIQEVADYLNAMIEEFNLLSSEGDSVTLKYAVPAEYISDIEWKLRRLAEEAMKSLERIEYMNDVLIVAPYQKPPYIERLHPRKDTNTATYWHRIRSNPFQKNYH